MPWFAQERYMLLLPGMFEFMQGRYWWIQYWELGPVTGGARIATWWKYSLADAWTLHYFDYVP